MTTELQILDLEEKPPAERPRTQLAVPESGPFAMALTALDRGISPERIEQMLALQERWERREAEKEFNSAMAAFSAEAIEIIKRKEVDFTSRAGARTHYWHAELSDVVEAVKPALAKHGFSYRWDTKQTSDWLEVTCILKHRLGHFETCAMGGPPDESGGKNRIQGFKSTKSYLERQTLEAICGVAEKGEDDDGRGGNDGRDGGDATGAQQEQRAHTGKKPYPADGFTQNMKAWQKAVNRGKAPAEVLATVEQFSPELELSADQRAAILALKFEPPVETKVTEVQQ